MYDRLIDYYDEMEARLLKDCIQCGNCINKCRVMPFTNMNFSPSAKDIQSNILGFLAGTESLGADAIAKVNSCMRCFGCTHVKCPVGISSMLINELVCRKLELAKSNPWQMQLYPSHDKLARRHSSENEYQRITTPVKNNDGNIMFFPGCNVYKQPDKLLNALTILDEIGIPYSFAPGLEYCCGWSVRGAAGDADWLQDAAKKLIDFADECGTKTLIFWCPTCACVFEERIKRFSSPDFSCKTFGQYVFDNIQKLSFPHAVETTLTYHEPCKTTYMNIDTGENSVRDILKAIPGTKLVEMANHDKNTRCCGCDAVDTNFAVGDNVTVSRLKEATETGATTLIDVCHNCHWIFKPAQHAHAAELSDIKVENYSTYITRAMGKDRPDSLD